MKKKVMIMAGGTGGHIFPALVVAAALADQGISVHWLGTEKGMENSLVKKKGYPLHTLHVIGLRGRRWYHQVTSLYLLLGSTMEAFFILIKLKPDAVLGMGGYVSAPGALAASLLRIRLIIHEQNAILGATNRLLRFFADSCLSAFPNTFPKKQKSYVTGNPIRESLLKLSPKVIKAGEPLHLLVLGGSQGAGFLNRLLPEVVAHLNRKKDKPKIKIWHISGKSEFNQTQTAYQDMLTPEATQSMVKVDPFCHTMEAAYGWATLVLCRAGAMTVSELSATGLASILVPYPHAVDDHQTANAYPLSQVGAAVLIQESKLKKDWLIETLEKYYHHPEALYKMAKAAHTLNRPNATQAVVKQVIDNI